MTEGFCDSNMGNVAVSERNGNQIVIPDSFLNKFSGSKRVVFTEYGDAIIIEPIKESKKRALIRKVHSMIK